MGTPVLLWLLQRQPTENLSFFCFHLGQVPFSEEFYFWRTPGFVPAVVLQMNGYAVGFPLLAPQLPKDAGGVGYPYLATVK